MRLFTAIEIPDGARRMLAVLQRTLAPLAPGVRWTRIENLHITLKFLGETPDAVVPEICSALEHIGLSRTVCIETSQTLRVARILCLPQRGPARIVAAGVDGDVERVASLFHRIESAVRPLGFPLEGRAFLPHITLGRARGKELGSFRQKCAESARFGLPGEPWLLNMCRLTLFQSITNQSGPTYIPLVRYYI